MKLVILGYYHYAEGFMCGGNALKKNGFTVDFFPWLLYNHRLKNIMNDHIVDFLNGQDNDYPKDNILFTQDEKADVALWWNTEVSIETLKYVKEKTNCINVLYSWYDPHSFFSRDINNDVVKEFDIVFSSCLDTVEYYKQLGINAVHLLAGFDKKIHYYEQDDEHKCDISLVCNNLYNDNADFRINREELMRELIEKTNYKINVYGPEQLKVVFPNNYISFIPFETSRKVFSNSKININTHINFNGDMYLNERTFQIMGSKGLMLVDNVKGIEKIFDVDKHCIILDRTNVVDQVKNILDNYDDYKKIASNGHDFVLNNHTWNNWAAIVKKNVMTLLKKKNKNIAKKAISGENDSIVKKIIPHDAFVCELIYLFKCIHNSTLPLGPFLNEIKYVCTMSNINANNILNKYFQKI